MRILHVTRETGADRRFGIGRSLDPVLAALRELGHEVLYLTQDDLGARARRAQQRLGDWSGRPARWLWGDAGAMLATTFAERCNMGRLAAKAALRWRADAVHLHDPWLAWGWRLARLAHPRASALHWGLSEHGFGAYAEATREEGLPTPAALLHRLRRSEALVLRRARFVICPTDAARLQLARDLALPQPLAHWSVVPHARPRLHPIDRAAARAALGLAPGLPHVVAVGRINPVKRLDAVVRACIALGRPLRLSVLAAGDASPLHALAREAPQLELEVASVDDVATVLAAADAYVSASRNESFGLANLEALALGVPAVCTAVGGVPEVTGGAAWLVPGGDEGLVEAIAQALRTLLDKPEVARELGERGRARALAWPDAGAVAKRLEPLYHRHPDGRTRT